MVPAPLSRVISVLVGISLGAVVTPETLKGLVTFPLSVAVLAVSTLCMIVATTAYLRFVHGWDAQSALLGASPGALAQVMVLSAEYKADLRAIAIVQTMRVVALTIGIPAGLGAVRLDGVRRDHGAAGGAGPASLAELAILVVVSTASALAIWRLRLPGGLMFGAMLGSGILHGGGFIAAALPWWVAGAAVIGIGAVTGSRFANTDSAHAVALSRRGARIVRGGDLDRVAVRAAPDRAARRCRIADAVVAFAPGAQDTMMVLALALHLDPVFVGALHLSRFLLVSLLVPFLAHRLRRGPPKPGASARRAHAADHRGLITPPPAGAASAAGQGGARPRPGPRPAHRSARRRDRATARCAAARCPSARSDS